MSEKQEAKYLFSSHDEDGKLNIHLQKADGSQIILHNCHEVLEDQLAGDGPIVVSVNYKYETIERLGKPSLVDEEIPSDAIGVRLTVTEDKSVRAHLQEWADFIGYGSKVSYGPWHIHEFNGDCPVEEGTEVQVMLRDGEIITRKADQYLYWERWDTKDREYDRAHDIIAYRVVNPENHGEMNALPS